MNTFARAARLLPICQAILKMQTDAPDYQQAGAQMEKCSLCAHFVRSAECDKHGFPADPEYVCGDFTRRQPDQGELKALVERYGARNSQSDLEILQEIHDHTIKLGALCHRPGPYGSENE